MSDNNLRLSSNKGTSCTAGNPQSFRFELYSDGILYFTIFKGIILQEDANRMLKEIRNHLYKESSEVIRTYLERHRVVYSSLHSGEIFLGHEKIMHLADVLLHGDSPNAANEHLRDADNYYATADHQKITGRNVCEGCYFAVKKIPYLHNGISSCRIIGQTFSDDCHACNPYGYFAVRATEKSQQFKNLVEISGEPILPDFGCVDTIGLLMDIDIITTSRQAEKFAL